LRIFFRVEYGRLVRAMYVDVGEAEDLAQEALARVLERWGSVASVDSPPEYAYRAGVNMHRSRLRRISRGAERLLTAAPSDPSSAPDEREDLRRVLQHYPMDQRAALLLVGVSGFSAEEAGKLPASKRLR
jgi:DNA-directed RNA polymerase specialized sigma24 family protein